MPLSYENKSCLHVCCFCCRNYNASKYSSSCGNTLGDFLKNATNRTNTSSSGFSSTETNLCHQEKDQQPTASDVSSRSFNKQTSAEVNKSGCQETTEWGDYRQHQRRGSNSVTKDSGLDFSHVQEDPCTGVPVTQAGAEQRKRNHKSKSETSRAKSLGDIVEPLNSKRLRPIRQKTRNAVVSIIDDGEVCLEFFHHKNGEDRVFEVLRISQNGMKISVYQPNGKSGVPLSLQPPSPPAGCESTCTYLFSNLPSKYWKKYQYATRFVHLVRKKTPKVGVDCYTNDCCQTFTTSHLPTNNNGDTFSSSLCPDPYTVLYYYISIRNLPAPSQFIIPWVGYCREVQLNEAY